MMKKKSLYNPAIAEKAIQAYWKEKKVWNATMHKQKKKYYVLDMFPYPSGAGLHVGHLLGYFASCTYATYKRMQGYEVLHPMGFDAFGLPAEQYAIETGQHPATTTEQNIANYKRLLERAGLSFDWSREFSTTDPAYYQWTQWLFLTFFNSWYDYKAGRARKIEELLDIFATNGNKGIAVGAGEDVAIFEANEWQQMSPIAQEEVLASYRLAYLSEGTVNWCPGLGTVLANEEVKDGFSERGGFPVEQRKMKQWKLRITAYADRLLADLEKLDWPSSTKEIQRNWIGRSTGAELSFSVLGEQDTPPIKVFTTRPDTIFGTTFLVVAPEHPLVARLCDKNEQVTSYVERVKNRSEIHRMQEANTITGVFTGYYAEHPFTRKKLPIWIADYVLGSYGTGAIMAVPAHDERDYSFAKHFDLPIISVIDGSDITQKAHMTKQGKMIHSDFLDGLPVEEAIEKMLVAIEERGLGRKRTNYRLRDAMFSRQRYWGEPFPIYYKEGVPKALSTDQLPLLLPSVSDYKPTAAGDPPLGNAHDWQTATGEPLELNTMPGWAGSSWYFFRYMDPTNSKAFAGDEPLAYWEAVDFYMGGVEHATGHLLYARIFTKVLYDLGRVSIQEPFQKLVHQGMIQGVSCFVYRIKGSNQFVSYGLKDRYDTTQHHVDIKLVKEGLLDLERFKASRPDRQTATFLLEENDIYRCGQEVEKMSKSKYNTVDPNVIIEQYGSDVLRLYLLFLGPITQSKPWSEQGIEGVARFLKKVWRLFHTQNGAWYVSTEPPTVATQQIIHQAIKQVTGDIARCSFNTCISALMICVNELTKQQACQQHTLTLLVRLLAPFAPHMAETLWQQLGHTTSIVQEDFPIHDPQYLVKDTVVYPIAINGKRRTHLEVPADISQEALEQTALNAPAVQRWLTGKTPKRIIIVPQKMVNIVV